MELVSLKQGKAVITVQTIVEASGNTENAVQKAIKNSEQDLYDLFLVEPESDLKSDLREWLPRSKTGKSIKWSQVVLEEDQAYFLITLLDNTDRVVEFKKSMIGAFRKMRNEILYLREQALITDGEKKVIDAVAEARALNTYTTDNNIDMISLGRYKQLHPEVSKEDIIKALQLKGWIQRVRKETVFTRLTEATPDYVADVVSGERLKGTVIFTEGAITSSLKDLYRNSTVDEEDE